MEAATQTTPDSNYRLIVLGDGSVRTIPLLGERWIIGRAPECTIPLRDPTVSRRHISLERHGDSFRFQDLGGSNPIMIDGRPMAQGVLGVGQTLLIGLTRLSLERRHPSTVIVPDSCATIMLSREVIDEELPSPSHTTSFVGMARRVLERIEWTFADLGGLPDIAEPLLDLALNLTGRRRGLIGRFTSQGSIETLASLDAFGVGQGMRLPEQAIAETRRLGCANILTMQEKDRAVSRLVVPLGPGPDGVMVLEEQLPDAAQGQELLRLGRTLGTVIWHRLQEAMERLRLREEVQRLRFQGTTAHNALLASTRLHELRQQLREIAKQSTAVLLLGEEGTEREDLARYLHVEGDRAKEPFLALNLASLPEWRREKELFGDGRNLLPAVERAAGGTLFLERADLLTHAQQQHLVDRLRESPRLATSERLARPRLVVASEPDVEPSVWLPAMAELIASHQLAVPPLRTDARDILALAELFLSDMGCSPDGSPRLLSERTKRLLIGYDWPGNVRELRQALETAAAQAGNQQIAPRHLPDHLAEPGNGGAHVNVPTLEDVEQRHIREVLQRVGGNRARAAQLLGIAASTLYEKLKRYSIES